MDHLVATPALPTMGLEPRYLRKRRIQTDVEQDEVPPPKPILFDELNTGSRVDEATGALRQRIIGAKPLAPHRLPAYLAMSIAAGLAALKFTSP